MRNDPMETISANRLEAYEERRERVQCFDLTSDLFFSKVLEDKPACQEVVQILLNRPEFTVKEVKAQYSIRNIENRSMTLDILAEDVDGHLVNIEMQIGEGEDHQKRVRYYQAGIDMSYLEKGVPYEEMPDVHLIFITDKDFLDRKSAIYYVERSLKDDGTVIHNGIHEVYANLTCKCEDEKINELLAYMKKSDSQYQTNLFPNVVKRVQFYKEKKEGVETMCRILDAERTKGIEEGMKKGMEKGMKEGIEEGMKAGLEEGSNRINELNRRLLSDGRKEDITKALENPKYQEALLYEYKL